MSEPEPEPEPEPELEIRTARGRMTLAAALDLEYDVLPVLTSRQTQLAFLRDTEERPQQILALVSRHLGIATSNCVLTPSSEWIFGTFNLCLPITILDTRSGRLPPRVVMRLAVPQKSGESFAPGTVDEKLRCEAATYVWLERECPMIPIPRLLGIGFPGCQSFTRIENESWLHWMRWQVRRVLVWLRGDTLPDFYAHHRSAAQDLGYILIEYVEHGAMLSSSWREHFDDSTKRKNLYAGLANIMLNLSRVPLPRIGSWTMGNEGTISLTNRPFIDLNACWARDRIPLRIPRDRTYSSTGSYLQDLLAYQDARMQHQPNSILSRKDGLYQLSALVGLRAILPQIFKPESVREQYALHLCDLHQSNIFVDDDWNITRIIDFEFACSYPIELFHVPHWLTDRSMDELRGPEEVKYKAAYDQFVNSVAEREGATQGTSTLSQLLREHWSSGRMWCVAALGSVNGFPLIFSHHLRPRYIKEWDLESHAGPLAQLWSENVSEFLEAKARDFQDYERKVREVFMEVAAIEHGQSAVRECLPSNASEVAKVEEPPVNAPLCSAEEIGGGEKPKD
ncbi:hypothetical protein Tdes44962_MAKER05583 [Teratosphaeria destructans]|uniref:Aminoglycoside phosphotransferase domain-containing protein n=1 Tax=Teratosphaeria destructans TaxID=418781 RepID=A0A9W7SJM0_9PEZI|nr:hypothetical protein Tdes44962_MAKER05583 [Teratosphaeria destructans]